jgi:DNA-binding NarL/FixJ family response regulator
MAGSIVTVSDVVPLRVLLGENNPSDVAILEHILTEMSVELRHCSSLVELEQHGKTWDADVVLLDLHLEDSQDFMVTARAVVALFPNIPILALTTLDNEEFALRALQAGLSRYLIKGTLSGADLMRTIKEAQARQRALQLSLPPTFNQDDLREMIHEAVRTALSEPKEPKERSSAGVIVLVLATVLVLVGGTIGFGYYQIQQAKNARKPAKKTQQDKKADQFQEFQSLRNAHLKKLTRWETGGKLGPAPKKPERLVQLEEELAK